MKLRTIVAMAVLCLSALARALAAAPAPDIGLITNVDNRETVSLNGDWKFIADPFEVGFYDYRWRPTDNGFFRDARPESPGDLVEYAFDTSPALKVPGDWNTQRDWPAPSPCANVQQCNGWFSCRC
jgi:beta-glucuronidase